MDIEEKGFENWWKDNKINMSDIPQALKNAFKELAFHAWISAIEWSDMQDRI